MTNSASGQSLMVSVLMMQERAPSQEAAERVLQEAKEEVDGCIGGRILPPGRSQKGRWRLVQTFYLDRGDALPKGMARLMIPTDEGAMELYGLTEEIIAKAANQ